MNMNMETVFDTLQTVQATAQTVYMAFVALSPGVLIAMALWVVFALSWLIYILHAWRANGAEAQANAHWEAEFARQRPSIPNESWRARLKRLKTEGVDEGIREALTKP